MDEPQPCPRCSEALLADPEHPRCLDSVCGCSCRDCPLDLSVASARLSVALLCQEALGRMLVESEKPEAQFVNGQVQDVLQRVMNEMMGLAGSSTVKTVPLNDVELDAVRELLGQEPAKPLLTDAEVDGVRKLLANPRRLAEPPAPPQAPRRPRPPQPAPEPDNELPSFDEAVGTKGFDANDDPDDESELEQEAPPPKRGKLTLPKALRGTQHKPMPKGHELTSVTHMQASAAANLGEKALEERRRGGATGSQRNHT